MEAASPKYEHFPHGADVGIRGIGETPEEAFAQAALAMTAAITDVERVSARDEIAIECEAETLGELFYDWIDALVFEMSTRGLLLSKFDVHIDGTRLRARAWGEPVDRTRHEPAVEVKGPTLTELSVGQASARAPWVAQCVVDV